MAILRIGIDVGGTNTDAVLLDTNLAHKPDQSVLAWHKTLTTSNITAGIQTATTAILASSPVNTNDIACVTVGTTHLINALIERNEAKLEQVAVIRLASQGFTQTTPPFIEVSPDLREVIYGGHVIIDGGLQIDGSEIGSVNKSQVLQACEKFRQDGVQNVVICGTYSPIDSSFNQEKRCADVINAEPESVDVFCSTDLGGLGILQRENAAVLNAAIHKYASFVFREIEGALLAGGISNCPVFISSNDGSMIPVAEAARSPIRAVMSGPANSMSGASYLTLHKSLANDLDPTDSMVNNERILILDVGGTTTDAGVLMKSGFPREASAYTAVVGVQVNFSMPDVTSFGLGGGSIVKTDAEGIVTEIGPESVGNDLTRKSLCFGGDMLTLTDIAIALDDTLNIGDVAVSIDSKIISSAQALLIAKFEDAITSAKTSSKPLPVVIVGGGAIICPKTMREGNSIMQPTLASVANAIGAACAQLSATVDLIFEASPGRPRAEEDQIVISATDIAAQKCIDNGATPDTIRTVERQITELAYIAGKIRVVIKVVGAFDGSSARALARVTRNEQNQSAVKTDLRSKHRQRRQIMYQDHPEKDVRLQARTNIASYHPSILHETWKLSEIDIEWLEIGCYILGCGGGGSPHLSSLAAKQLLRQGKTLSIVSAENLASSAILPPIGILGSPMVSVERPGGNLCADALGNMLKHLGIPSHDAGLCVEIGGSNGLSPLLASRSDRQNTESRPMVDGDLMGRAFPTFEMVTPYLFAKDINHILPASLSSGTGTNMILSKAQDTAAVDAVLRACCVTMGCAAGVVSGPLTAAEFVEQGLLNTHSAAWRLGRAVQLAQSGCCEGTPVETVVEAYGGLQSGRILFEGKIAEVTNRLIKGHSVGQLIVEGFPPPPQNVSESPGQMKSQAVKERVRQQMGISFKNENLIAELIDESGHNKVLATVPDLISVLDSRTGLAVGVPEYRYGLRVSVVALAAPPKWTSPRGLEVAGPRCFSFEQDFQSIGVYTPPRSVIEEYGGK